MANPSVAAHGSSATSGTTSYTAAITIVNAGDYLVLHHLASSSGGIISSITDNATNHYTWVKLQGAVAGLTGGEVWLGTASATSPPSGALTVTVTMSASTSAAIGNLYEIANVFKPGPVVRSSAIVSTTTATVAVTYTPLNTGDLVMMFVSGAAANVSTNPSGGGWTLVDFPTVGGTQYGGGAYQNGTRGSALSATWGMSGSGQAYGFSVVFSAPESSSMLALL